jgi:hypothetical protein
MGEHVMCSARYREQSSYGKASLEPDKLLFSGDFRLSIPLKEIRKAVAEDGDLKITYNNEIAAFHLKELAEKWAKKITSPKKLIDKLGVKAGAKVAVLNISDEAFREQLKERTENISSEALTNGMDFIFFQVENTGELEEIKNLRNFLAPNGALWVAIPKGRKDIRVENVIAAAKASDLVDVKLVGFSETHSMYKLVIPLSSR